MVEGSADAGPGFRGAIAHLAGHLPEWVVTGISAGC